MPVHLLFLQKKRNRFCPVSFFCWVFLLSVHDHDFRLLLFYSSIFMRALHSKKQKVDFWYRTPLQLQNLWRKAVPCHKQIPSSFVESLHLLQKKKEKMEFLFQLKLICQEEYQMKSEAAHLQEKSGIFPWRCVVASLFLYLLKHFLVLQKRNFFL